MKKNVNVWFHEINSAHGKYRIFLSTSAEKANPLIGTSVAFDSQDEAETFCDLCSDIFNNRDFEAVDFLTSPIPTASDNLFVEFNGVGTDDRDVTLVFELDGRAQVEFAAKRLKEICDSLFEDWQQLKE